MLLHVKNQTGELVVTDNTNEIQEATYFLKTKLNEKYLSFVPKEMK
ncbi:MAG: hypothetical protein PWQ42_842, partial [Sulfurospirillum sp.]|nr:hypothetical protein [Sulfurospirillum sp.]